MISELEDELKAYILVRIKIEDGECFKAYMAAAPAIIAQYGGRYLARGGASITLEGPEETRRLTILEFPTLAAARAFYDSEEYAKVRQLRMGAATAEFVALEGIF